MSCCADCINVCTIEKCGNDLVIGTIADVDTDVFVYADRIDGRSQKQLVTSDGTGKVTMDLTDPSPHYYDAQNIFEIYVTATNASNPSDRYEVTLMDGETTGECFNVKFFQVFEGEDYSDVQEQALTV